MQETPLGLRQLPMRKVLLVTTAYPPPAVSGVLRIIKLMRWLPTVGYEPTLLTIAQQRLPDPNIPRFPDDPPNVYRVECRMRINILKRKPLPEWTNGAATRSMRSNESTSPSRHRHTLRRLFHNLFEFPDATAPWIRRGIRAGLELAASTKFDLIYSSAGMGVSGHFVAARLQARLGLPWVHEYRDLWGDNPWRWLRPYPWRLWRELRAEHQFLDQAALCIVMSGGDARILAHRQGSRFANRIEVVGNGFDPAEFPEDSGPPVGLPLRLCYTGILYGGKRDSSVVFAAIRLLIDRGIIGAQEVQFVYAGDEGLVVRTAAAHHGLEHRVCDREMLPAVEAKRLQLQSHILCLLEVADDDEWVKFNVPGKTMEYFGARRPVLALAHPGGAIADLIREANVGSTFHPRDVEGVAHALEAYLTALRANGQILYSPNEAVMLRYRWDGIAARLAVLFDGVLDPAGAGHHRHGCSGTPSHGAADVVHPVTGS
jgi:glycosyltransferase involved in cell wall biosynthesis